ncbi:MAG: hypothetical protein K0Q69_1380 [Devosia sp.]|jgi:FlaG/FlaF family flagellin (archaellin)|nr:hypothetical protein [Devosia sp.]
MTRTVILAVAVASFALVAPALSEQKSDAGSTTDNTTLCKAIYEIYDLNMEAYYSKNKTNRQRQEAYTSAQRAMSDFRKKGCKYKDVVN